MIEGIQGGLAYLSLLELSLKGGLAFGTGGGRQNREAALRCDRPVGCLSCLHYRVLGCLFPTQERSCLTRGQKAQRCSGEHCQLLPLPPTPPTDLGAVSHALSPGVPGSGPHTAS